MNRKKLIIINGPSCSGKSSVIKGLMQKENLFYLHYDSIKWFFSKYKREKHSQDVNKLCLEIVKKILNLNYNIVSDSFLKKSDRKKLINLAKERKYKIIEINLEADFNILLKRFEERVKSALTIPKKERKISNTSKRRFKELFEIYHKNKNKKAITFRTDTENSKKIVQKINKIIQ